MPVCLDSSNDIDLLSKLKEYLKNKYNKPGNVYLGLVHRLDRPVEGIIVFAKTSKAASRLSKQITENKFQKTYYAVIENNIRVEMLMMEFMLIDLYGDYTGFNSLDEAKNAFKTKAISLGMYNYHQHAPINGSSEYPALWA